ncbi:MAG: hypothetical protein MJB14_18715, partial [Spirochaetes bacterium]|nr:hypothetical protein [Spirochaetota bacterium]
MKWFKKLLQIILFCFLFSCTNMDQQSINDKIDALFLSQKKETKESLLFKKNSINLANGYPFYILQPGSLLYLQSPADCFNFIQSVNIELKFGDIVFPVKGVKPQHHFFYVKTIAGQYGWISNLAGISLDYDEDSNLYYFSNKSYWDTPYYQQRFIQSNGNPQGSDLIILSKNIVPMLLGNYTTEGWFYPENFQLALHISEQAVKMAENKSTFFLAPTMFDKWKPNEKVIAL